MTNPNRGEGVLILAGQRYRLKLTLGAMAEIEHGLGLDHIDQLPQALARPKLNTLLIVVQALMRAGDAKAPDVRDLPVDIGAMAQALTGVFASLETPS